MGQRRAGGMDRFLHSAPEFRREARIGRRSVQEVTASGRALRLLLRQFSTPF
jgi:hypothetical protein